MLEYSILQNRSFHCYLLNVTKSLRSLVQFMAPQYVTVMLCFSMLLQYITLVYYSSMLLNVQLYSQNVCTLTRDFAAVANERPTQIEIWRYIYFWYVTGYGRCGSGFIYHNSVQNLCNITFLLKFSLSMQESDNILKVS